MGVCLVKADDVALLGCFFSASFPFAAAVGLRGLFAGVCFCTLGFTIVELTIAVCSKFSYNQSAEIMR